MITLGLIYYSFASFSFCLSASITCQLVVIIRHFVKKLFHLSERGLRVPNMVFQQEMTQRDGRHRPYRPKEV